MYLLSHVKVILKSFLTEYKNWWIPVVEKIVIPEKKDKKVENPQSGAEQQVCISNDHIYLYYLL
jgi:hypothetical protein